MLLLDFSYICSDTSSMEEDKESFTSAVVELSSTESSSQTRQSVSAGEKTSTMINSASPLTSDSDLKGTSDSKQKGLQLAVQYTQH